ncbi:MAG: nucleotidyl transferase AbiEii/AbiGii toxin family protein [Syntrophaceae bacterium]|nr:nucleotidyl transferase AbiEii/AbiGii toxin family protein [Syntrophaceae bacterium]
MKVSREFLISESESSGFRPEMLEKVFHLIGLMNGLNVHPFLKDRLALKGGTALNLFVFDLPRLSVDIDLNYVGFPDREAMLADRPKIETTVKAVSNREGLGVRRTASDHAAMTIFIRYQSVLGQGGDLKVDLNFMFRIPIWPIVKMDSLRMGPFMAKDVPLLDIHELAAGKLTALLARRASRDLFDGHALLKKGKLDYSKLRLAFIVLGAMNRKDWRSVQASDLDFSESDLRSELLPLLRKDAYEREDLTQWAQRLVSETRNTVATLLSFTETEREFLDRLLDHGEIAPWLLTKDEELVDRIKHHPGLAWKAKNVREFKSLESQRRQ